MGYRCNVFYRCDTQARLLKRGNGGFTARAGTLDLDFNLTHSITNCGAGTFLCGTLSGKRSAFTRTLKTNRTR